MHILYHKCSFAAAHFYREKGLSDEQNHRKFHPYDRIHGHNFSVIIALTGTPNPANGMLVNFYDIEQIVNHYIVSPFDINLINNAHPWFIDHIPSTENLAFFFFQTLHNKFPDGIRLLSVEVAENDEFSSRYEPERI